MNRYKPEGSLLGTRENDAFFTYDGLSKAKELGMILEGRARGCDADNNLYLDLGDIRGVIPREEALLGEARGIAIISRVGKPVCFKVLSLRRETGGAVAVLSRRAAQEEAAENHMRRLVCGDIVDARVTHLEQFGAFVDIGCGLISLLPIDQISVSRIFHPAERFRVGQDIRAVVRSVDRCSDRVTLSQRELLGTWEQNAARVAVGMTVAGVVRGIESYGIFVELSENLAGLAEYRPGVRDGQTASVYIKSILPEKMKIKLVIIDVFDAPSIITAPHYFCDSTHIDHWRYSPKGCDKVIETVFGE